MRADLRYRYSPHGHRLEQDVILRQRPALPAGLLAEHGKIECWTEWFDSVPTARQSQTVDLRRGSGLTNLPPARVADEELTFGAARVGAGFAFSTGAPGERTPVAKAWLRASGRDWLVETVDFPALKRKLDTLAAAGSASVTRPGASTDELIASLAENRSADLRSGALAMARRAGSETGAPLAQLSTLNSQLSDQITPTRQ